MDRWARVDVFTLMHVYVCRFARLFSWMHKWVHVDVCTLMHVYVCYLTLFVDAYA